MSPRQLQKAMKMPAKHTKNTYETSFITQTENTVVNAPKDGGTPFIVNSNTTETEDFSSIGFDRQAKSREHQHFGVTDGGTHTNQQASGTASFLGTEDRFNYSGTSNDNHANYKNNYDVTYPTGEEYASQSHFSQNKTGSNTVQHERSDAGGNVVIHENAHGDPSADYFLL